MLNLLFPPPLSLYIHYPWCIRKCPYCDFNSHTNTQAQNKENDFKYVEALIKDLSNDLPSVWGRRICSIFIGGGTPSLINPDALDLLFSQLKSLLNFSPDIEITLEANPGTVDYEKFKSFHEIGINRLSIGVQSFDDNQLLKLGRIHSSKEAHHAIEKARQAGFDNLNLDLMYALPGQTLTQALYDIEQVIQHQPNHISYYQLTIEPNTPFAHTPPMIPDDESAYTIQSDCHMKLKKSGFCRYEISAWHHSSNNNAKSKHNLNYWNFGDYLGIGAGAHSKITRVDQQRIIRSMKHKHPKDYLNALNSDGTKPFIQQQHNLKESDLIFEYMLNSSRLIEGFSINQFAELTGLEENKLEPYFEKAIARGFIMPKNDMIIPTELGINFLNDFQLIFLNDQDR